VSGGACRPADHEPLPANGVSDFGDEGRMPERTPLGEQIGPTTFVEEYGDETVYFDNSGRKLVQVEICREDARELVNMLRCRLNASRRPA
jgi:hypothetical protein